QTSKVPEVAAQRDAITAATEMATQNVMNRLDVLMAKTEDAGRFFTELQKSADENKTWHERIFSEIYNFLDRAKNGEKTATLAQEILDYVFELQVSPKPKPIDVTEGQSIFQSVSDEAFEILNILQFQDITRQKIEKIIQLLKHFRQSLDRLLEIFKIKEEEEVEETTEEGDDVFKNRNVATQDNIFNTNVTANKDTGSIDDIIAQFKAHQ
ncbi:MAG: hypothetical protein LBH03_00865, partial [Holophagales bacterium]|nr:hypothetical protein [Holophagales bacterium]